VELRKSVGQGRRDAEPRVIADPAPALSGAMLASYRRAIACVAAVEGDIRAAATRLAVRWERGGRCIYLGAGAAGLVAAEDAAELPGTFGLDRRRIAIILAGRDGASFDLDAAAEDDAQAAEQAVAALGDLGSDAVIAVSASGSTPFTLAGAKAARRAGAFVIAIANRPNAPLLTEADIGLLLDTGDEALQGSTRLAAGVAQKCALGMLSTLVGLALGHIHAGLMVNLRADNDKLQRRALGIVMSISGVAENTAQAALAAAGGEVKQAVLLSSGARDCGDAVSRLARSRGRLAEALDTLRKELGRSAADEPRRPPRKRGEKR
jgi:N-acetylmuramic acid 6-phosphate etherase